LGGETIGPDEALRAVEQYEVCGDKGGERLKCPACGIEAEINRTRTEVSGDQSADTETVVDTVLEYICRNPACERFQHNAGETRHRVYPAEEM